MHQINSTNEISQIRHGRRRLAAAAGVFLAALVGLGLYGCGDDNSPADSPTATGTDTPPATAGDPRSQGQQEPNSAVLLQIGDETIRATMGVRPMHVVATDNKFITTITGGSMSGAYQVLIELAGAEGSQPGPGTYTLGPAAEGAQTATITITHTGMDLQQKFELISQSGEAQVMAAEAEGMSLNRLHVIFDGAFAQRGDQEARREVKGTVRFTAGG